jgi:hypothetical protein
MYDITTISVATDFLNLNISLSKEFILDCLLNSREYAICTCATFWVFAKRLSFSRDIASLDLGGYRDARIWNGGPQSIQSIISSLLYDGS